VHTVLTKGGLGGISSSSTWYNHMVKYVEHVVSFLDVEDA
jgi:hypothetical protein